MDEEILFSDILHQTRSILSGKRLNIPKTKEIFRIIEDSKKKKEERIIRFFEKLSERLMKKINLEEFFIPAWIDIETLEKSGGRRVILTERMRRQCNLIRERILAIIEHIHEEAVIQHGEIVADDFRRMCAIM